MDVQLLSVQDFMFASKPKIGVSMIKEKDLKKLHAETPVKERKYRVGNTFEYSGKKFANMLCYVDARYVQDKVSVIGVLILLKSKEVYSVG